jgi:Protein of unknown function (DUF2867)
MEEKVSVALDVLPRPDWASTTSVAIPRDLTRDPVAWAQAIFDSRTMPSWVKVLFVVRECVVRPLRITPGDSSMLAVDRVVGDEAVIDTDDVHLHFVAGVRADARFVHVTTVVAFKGWRGRLYFLPVRLLHDAVTRAMITRAARALRNGRDGQI